MSAWNKIASKWRLAVLALMAALIAVATASTLEEVPPDTLHIGNTNFKVEMGPFKDSFAGMTYFDKKLIRIDPSSTAALRRKVYLHELMHVAWHQGKPSADKKRAYTEDEAIEELVPGLLKVLEQNPQAVEYLRGSGGSTIAQSQMKK